MQRYSEQELYAMRDKYQDDLSRLQQQYNEPLPGGAEYHKSMSNLKYNIKRDIDSVSIALGAINSIITNIQGTTPEERLASLTQYYDKVDSDNKSRIQAHYDKQEQQRLADLAQAKKRWAQEDQEKISKPKKSYFKTPNGQFKYNPQLYPKFSTEDLYCTRFMPKNIADELRTYNSQFQKFLWDPCVKRWHMVYSTSNQEVKFNGFDKYKEYFCNPQQNILAKEWSSTIQHEQTLPETPEDRPLTLKVHGKLTI